MMRMAEAGIDFLMRWVARLIPPVPPPMMQILEWVEKNWKKDFLIMFK